MSEETEKAGRYRLFAARLRAVAADALARENHDLLCQVAADFEETAEEFEAIDQLKRSLPEAVPRIRASNQDTNLGHAPVVGARRS
jgi:hypothetical protein